MSRSGDILEAIRVGIAVAGSSYDLSPTGAVLVGMYSAPAMQGAGAFACLYDGALSTSEGADLSVWTYRTSVIIEAWAGSDGSDQAARIAAAQNLRSDLLASLHATIYDPVTRAAAMTAAAVRDVQVSSAVMSGDLVSDAWAGWGYVQVEVGYTADGDPGAY